MDKRGYADWDGIGGPERLRASGANDGLKTVANLREASLRGLTIVLEAGIRLHAFSPGRASSVVARAFEPPALVLQTTKREPSPPSRVVDLEA
jgi:hypothetical protein